MSNKKFFPLDQCFPLQQVKEFHELFNHPVLQDPTIPDTKRCALRHGLIAEELRELDEAIIAKDIVGVADALVDLQYVLSGAILEFGLAGKFPSLFNEVHRSNMSKACTTELEAMETAQACLRETGEACHIVAKGSLFLVHRIKDGKTIKSVNYSTAKLKPIVNGAENF